ncbi:MAG: type II secretion system protein [Dehalococcoidales bacterium]|nr:type II secretion system protein [Dehalococcoidales bacterium]
MKAERGFILIETLVALAILGIVAVALLSGMATTTKATVITSEQAIADSLVRSEIEYVKSCAYQSHPATYPIDGSMDIPAGWTVPAPSTSLVHVSDDGIQQVTVSATRNGKTVLSVKIYKVDR